MRIVHHATTLIFLLVLAACAALLWYTHSNIGAVISVSALLGSIPIAIGFGLQTVLQGIIAGMVIRFERKVRKGQWVTIAGITGQVVAINLRTTELDTDTARAVLPNTTVLTSPILILKEPPCQPSPSSSSLSTPLPSH